MNGLRCVEVVKLAVVVVWCSDHWPATTPNPELKRNGDEELCTEPEIPNKTQFGRITVGKDGRLNLNEFATTNGAGGGSSGTGTKVSAAENERVLLGGFARCAVE